MDPPTEPHKANVNSPMDESASAHMSPPHASDTYRYDICYYLYFHVSKLKLHANSRSSVVFLS